MTSPAADDVLERLRRNSAVRDEAAAAEPDLVLAALDAGKRQKDVADAAGRTREWVRQLVRKHRGIEADDDEA